jgi:hypothetical protein
LSPQELGERLDELPPAEARQWYQRYLEGLSEATFGAEAPRNSKGERTECGQGSPGNETAQSVAAYEKWGRNDPDYEKQLVKKRANLAACNERRAKERAAKPQDWWR